MSLSPPFTDVIIKTEKSGFYKGYNLPIALISKTSVALLVVWALGWPEVAASILSSLNTAMLTMFNSLYIYSVGFFAFFLLALTIYPKTGSIILGKPGEKPEFSNFSWFSMMFGAGLGVALMVYATGEPLLEWISNPETILGNVEPLKAETVKSTYRYVFLHNGFHAWSIYAVTAIPMAYFAYTRDMPLTLRVALTPLLGKHINGVIGHTVDILGVIATVLGIAVTIGFGISQLADGAYLLSGADWLITSSQTKEGSNVPSLAALIVGLLLVMGLSILSAVSGVGKGVKYLSNMNSVLSFVLLGVFIIFGAFAYSMEIYGIALLDYIKEFAILSFTAYDPKSLAGQWQITWTTFYWSWWIAFAPFVGLFLARISRGRSIREFVFGAIIVPSLVTFAWMTILGGTSIHLELFGDADGAIVNASTTSSLFVTMEYMFGETGQFLMTILSTVLVITFLVTSADSGVLVLNTIIAGGKIDTGRIHRVIWGILLTLVIGTLLIAGSGRLDALQNAMIIGALPFTILLVLMCISLMKAIYRDTKRLDNDITEES
ncbi:MAG: BCCT family transporter [Gammaproteobacteria bacterium]|nr:BCCT family transporter [Gammaproteobacteria bacterium]